MQSLYSLKQNYLFDLLIYSFYSIHSNHYFLISRLTIESRGQEETAIIRETKNTRPLSELFTRKSVHKTTNAVVKRHKRYLLVTTDLYVLTT